MAGDTSRPRAGGGEARAAAAKLRLAPLALKPRLCGARLLPRERVRARFAAAVGRPGPAPPRAEEKPGGAPAAVGGPPREQSVRPAYCTRVYAESAGLGEAERGCPPRSGAELGVCTDWVGAGPASASFPAAEGQAAAGGKAALVSPSLGSADAEICVCKCLVGIWFFKKSTTWIIKP